jgi:hypothetical protein
MLRHYDIQPVAASASILDEVLSFAWREILRFDGGQKHGSTRCQESGSFHMFHHTHTMPLCAINR